MAAPLAAALGVRVAAMSDRGLAHTGGTIDKLEAIPGYVAELPLGRFVRQVRDVGIAVGSQTARLAPGDRRLYALRDATGTVPGAGLIAASLMSKKIAGGAGAVALDVQAGGGGFFAAEGEAREAAELMAALAEPWGRTVRWTVSAMDQPLGAASATPSRCARPARCCAAAARPTCATWRCGSPRNLAEAAASSTTARGPSAPPRRCGPAPRSRRAERWVEAQEGDPGVLDRPGRPAPGAGARGGRWPDRPGSCGASTPGRSARRPAGWAPAGCTPTSPWTRWPASSCWRRSAPRSPRGSRWPIVHARDDWAAERGREMVAGALRVGPEAAAAPGLVLAEGRGGAGAP